LKGYLMRLCYLADPLSSHTVKWLRYFVESGDEVHLLGWNRPRQDELSSVHCHYLPDELPLPFSKVVRSLAWRLGCWPAAHLRQMQLLLQRIRPDIFDILMLNAPQIPAALACDVPLVITPWGHDLLVYPEGYSNLTKLFLRLALRKADLVLCNSSRLKEAARRLGARSKRIRDVNQIVDLSLYNPDADGCGFRTSLGLVGDPVLLSPRSLDPDYRIHTLIDAMPRILEHYPECQLVLVGDRKRCPDYVDMLTRKIRELSLEAHVLFAGYVPNHNMPAVFGAASVVLSVPFSDSRPSSVFEAMACGVPVIVSDVPAIHEIVQHQQTGIIVPIDAPDAVAEAVAVVLADEQQTKRMTTGAREFVSEAGDFTVQMKKVAEYYREIVKE
jgi:glycosyltransferase involved in cell wall biosynthesis